MFTVQASKDVDGANLDRKLDKQGKLATVGNTVDLKTAKYENSIGATSLMGCWTDIQFNPEQHAFYYP
ncbi:DUF3604 domain-containing protein [Psychromonas sp. RZ22]|nr:DUF3604 domain-containing protein [Psychromonas sp. RZ22]